MKKTFNASLLEMDIKKHSMEDKLKEITFNYHNDLLSLLEARQNKDIHKTAELTDKVNDGFSLVVCTNNHIINQSFDIAKKTLEEAFERCGIIQEKIND